MSDRRLWTWNGLVLGAGIITAAAGVLTTDSFGAFGILLATLVVALVVLGLLYLGVDIRRQYVIGSRARTWRAVVAWMALSTALLNWTRHDDPTIAWVFTITTLFTYGWWLIDDHHRRAYYFPKPKKPAARRL